MEDSLVNSVQLKQRDWFVLFDAARGVPSQVLRNHADSAEFCSPLARHGGAADAKASHNPEHYGNLVVHMRPIGIVPLSSDPKQ
jgi:hypothetical protein